MSDSTRTGATRPLALFSVLAVLVAAFNLRTAIVSVGAVLDDVITAFGASEALAGLITAIPGVAFGLFGIAAVPLARRIGLSGALSTGMIIGLIGLALRPWTGDICSFIFLTGLVVSGIAVANILLPAWIKLHGGTQTVLLMTIYTTVLGIGSTVGPLSALLFSGDDAWRRALFFWAGAGLIQVLVWVPMWLIRGNDFPPATVAAGRRGRIWTSSTAVYIMLFFGLQSMHAYIVMGWLPKILTDSGLDPGRASVGLSIVGFMGIVGGIAMPVAIARTRSRNLARFPVVFAAAMFLGYLGIWLQPTQGWALWSFLLGLGSLCFPMAIALIPARTRDPRVTASLSGFAQPVGYILAALGPALIGALYQWWASWTPILLLLAATTAVLAVVGARAARPVVVDDELESGGDPQPHLR